jgi:hypothetical protein
MILCCPACTESKSPAVLSTAALREYVEKFNVDYQEIHVNAIPNREALQFLENNIPLFECPDKEIERTYYFRWWTFRKHIKATPDGYVITEFLPDVSWAKKHNTINGDLGHHLYEGRWLHDRKYLDDYLLFYFGRGYGPNGFGKGVSAGGDPKYYSNWVTDGVYARFQVNGNRQFTIDLLDGLLANYNAWSQDGTSGEYPGWHKNRLLENGLYWQVDSWGAQEHSIGGTGIRVPINSYMFADAMAISHIAELAGKPKLSEKYRAKAEQLRSLVQDQLWDEEDSFFKTRRLRETPLQYNNLAAEECKPEDLVSVREIFGYVPWQFNLPEEGQGYEEAWRQLTDPQGFLGKYGPTAAERRHPNFRINESGCMWCGASWPYVTSQTLVALANLLNNYKQEVIGPQEYFNTLMAYARSHKYIRKDGTSVSWIDESLNPDTGKWIINWQNQGGRFPNTRGCHYNHSTFCDLVITGLVGLRPREDDLIEVHPLVPKDTWEWFCLDNVLYHDHILTILWDQTGNKYGLGPGLKLLVDGKEIAGSKTLNKITAYLE